MMPQQPTQQPGGGPFPGSDQRQQSSFQQQQAATARAAQGSMGDEEKSDWLGKLWNSDAIKKAASAISSAVYDEGSGSNTLTEARTEANAGAARPNMLQQAPTSETPPPVVQTAPPVFQGQQPASQTPRASHTLAQASQSNQPNQPSGYPGPSPGQRPPAPTQLAAPGPESTAPQDPPVSEPAKVQQLLPSQQRLARTQGPAGANPGYPQQGQGKLGTNALASRSSQQGWSTQRMAGTDAKRTAVNEKTGTASVDSAAGTSNARGWGDTSGYDGSGWGSDDDGY